MFDFCHSLNRFSFPAASTVSYLTLLTIVITRHDYRTSAQHRVKRSSPPPHVQPPTISPDIPESINNHGRRRLSLRVQTLPLHALESGPRNLHPALPSHHHPAHLANDQAQNLVPDRLHHRRNLYGLPLPTFHSTSILLTKAGPPSRNRRLHRARDLRKASARLRSHAVHRTESAAVVGSFVLRGVDIHDPRTRDSASRWAEAFHNPAKVADEDLRRGGRVVVPRAIWG